MENQVVFVTGGAMGMGEAVAVMAAERGAKVVVADINEEAALKTVEKIKANGGEASAVKCDVSSAKDVEAAINFVVEKYGRLDAAFNNAGIQPRPSKLADLPEEEYDKVMSINLKGTLLTMKYELLQMQKQGSGAIVNNSSIGGLVAGAGRAAYHATKHGVLGLTKSAAVEYAPEGIRINAVCPGVIETPMVDEMFALGDLDESASQDWAPIKRLGKASEVAETVLWLFSPASSYIIGQPISVDGGISIT
ncbi:NAD(P)-dependent dehydrogenase, short-chain alcohol dehydrogenase family [Chryseobacterium arachidis]|uniref:NAD(P)-dependent dehydrogenase, short-chain alcohol dehydrogenase family n=1 Tax=Chryseobacterium arachidis TaxID=1416778 RepID=A0A1M5HY67_9FLAO|nr:SDR family NAD(P)-dependent oxidoreductase [Chryseobacterium arachidis]SHG20924.1 NAD(P)-dependent dehydrogenase, short-chain alcohol dehydrogenase family [Chryseobacterium arachidis]